MPRNRRRECTNWRSMSSHLSVCVLFGHETRVRTIRHVFVAFLWIKLSKWLALVQCKRLEEINTLFVVKIQSFCWIVETCTLPLSISTKFSPPLQSKEVYLNVQFSKRNIPIFSSGYTIYAERMKVTFRHENIKILILKFFSSALQNFKNLIFS